MSYKEHPWNFDDAMSIEEFFDSYGAKKKAYKIVTCTNEETGDHFKALRLNTGKKQTSGKYKGRPVYAFFCLSRPLERQGEVLDKDFLREHWDTDLKLLSPPDEGDDTLKFGLVFLEDNDDDFDELND